MCSDNHFMEPRANYPSIARFYRRSIAPCAKGAVTISHALDSGSIFDRPAAAGPDPERAQQKKHKRTGGNRGQARSRKTPPLTMRPIERVTLRPAEGNQYGADYFRRRSDQRHRHRLDHHAVDRDRLPAGHDPQSRISKNTAQEQAYSGMLTQIQSLQTIGQAFQRPLTFAATTANSSDPTVLTATTTDGATRARFSSRWRDW